MIELIFIFFQLFFFLIIFSIGGFNIAKKNYSINNDSFIYENFSNNIIIQLNLILFLSFLNFSLDQIVYSYLIFIFVLLIYNFKFFISKNSFINFEVFFLIFICLIIFFNISFNLTLSWDAEKFWFDKALNYYNGDSIDNLKNLNRSYNPHLGGLIWAFFWKLSLISNEYAGRLFYGFFYIISISLLISNLKTKNIYKFILILLVILSTYDYRILFSGNKEILIFSIICLLLHSLNKLSKKKVINENKEILIFIFSTNLLLWSKQVGFVYLISLIIPLIFFFKISINKKIIIVASCCALYFLKFFIYKFYNFDLNLKSCCYNDFTVQGIINKITIERIFLIFSYLFFYLFQNFIFIIGFIFLIIGFQDKKFLHENKFLYTSAMLNFIFVFIIYLLTDADLDLMLRTGIERLLFMFSPIFLLLIINYLNKNYKLFKYY